MAAGKVPLLPMTGVGVALAAGGLALAFWLSAAAGLWILAYLAVTCAYSLSLKRKIFIDVTALAMLYAVRVLAGAAAALVPLSPWLLAFFLFVFLALAIVKRQGELRTLRGSERAAPRRPSLSCRRLAANGGPGRGERRRFGGDSDPCTSRAQRRASAMPVRSSCG